MFGEVMSDDNKNINTLSSTVLMDQIESVDKDVTIVFKDKKGEMHYIDMDVFIQGSRNRIVLFEEGSI